MWYLTPVSLYDMAAMEQWLERMAGRGTVSYTHLDVYKRQGLCHDVQGQGGLAGGLGAVDLHNAPPGHAPDAQGQIQGILFYGDFLHMN